METITITVGKKTFILDKTKAEEAFNNKKVINGRQTMGENIGDLSGIAVAYRAYKMSLKGKEAPVIGGYTGDQRFFLGFAQIWRFKSRDEALRNQLLTDAHSPGYYRAFVPLTNIDAWYTAFNVKPGDKLYRAPEDRVKIW